jgi:hypothetical protein
MKRHVLVNGVPRVIWVLSGTVTSSTITALSWQEPFEDEGAVPVTPGVPGVVVVASSGVDVDGVCVASAKPGRVGGSVDVTKGAALGPAVSFETVTHEVRLMAAKRSNVQSFFIDGILL